MKRVAAIGFLSFVTLVAAGAGAPATAQVPAAGPAASPQGAGTGVHGDANCDDTATAADIVSVLAASQSQLPFCGRLLADVTCDGQVNTRDALDLARWLADLPALDPGDGCPEPGASSVLGPGSDELIDEAVAGGVDENQGLLYKTFALFDDNRLPPEYSGDSRVPVDHGVMKSVQAAFASMTAEQQELVQPYLLPPMYEGSWTDRIEGIAPSAAPSALPEPIPKVNWKSTEGAHIRVWYTDTWDAVLGMSETAGMLNAAQLVSAEPAIWAKLTQVMGREPLSDALEPFGGSDGLLDVYLVRLASGRGLTSTFDSCREDAAYIQLTYYFSDYVQTISAFVHELMHAIQFAFSPADCEEIDWWSEATANWAIEYVDYFRWANPEHDYAPEYFTSMTDPLEMKKNGTMSYHGRSYPSSSRHYGAYVFPWFIDFHEGSPGMVRQSWENSALLDSLYSIDAALPDGFKEQWPRFALASWNDHVRHVQDDYFRQDALQYGAWDALRTPTNVDLEGQTTAVFPMAADVQHLAVKYHWYKFDEAVSQVGFYNEFGSFIDDNIRVQALVKIEGDSEWKEEDFSDERFTLWCRERPEERIEELVIIVSNATFESKQHVAEANDTRLTAHLAPCSFEGTASSSLSTHTEFVDFTLTTQSDLYWDLYGDEPDENAGYGCQDDPDPCFIYLPEGHIDWSYSYESEFCSESLSGRDATGNVIAFQDQILILYPDGQGGYTYEANGYSNTSYPAECFPSIEPTTGFLFAPVFEDFPVTNNGRQISGSYTNEGGQPVWTWDFRR